ncbi:MAG: short-chain dehydrogenase [Gammaproteobacteria bacterium]|nr:MAG: short-chain dehydrogenase [Gammaproteobacteria bacterium]
MLPTRSILITGCSSGIGLDAARTLKSRGWRVFASCRQASDCERLRAEGFDSPLLDYRDSDSIRCAVDEVLRENGGSLDALFNNGAYAIPGFVEDLPRDALREIFEVNLFGQFELINQLLPTFHAQGHGRIVNCSSVLGFAAMKHRGAYNATKFAMEGLTDTLRLELTGSGIEVILIQPGPIATRFRENSIPHFERWIDVQSSRYREIYETLLKPRLHQPDEHRSRFELGPAAVSKALIAALEHPRPRPRYHVTLPTRVAALLKRSLGSRVFYWLVAR